MSDNGGNRTIERALAVLETLSESDEGLSLHELAAELELPKSTCHNILSTLTKHGYLLRTGDKRYRLSFKMFQIGSRQFDRLEVKAHALPVLKQITKETGESSHLAVPLDTELIFVERVESHQSVRASASVGTVLELHAPATGKAMLAFMKATRRLQIMRRLTYHKYTDHTMTSPEALQRELDEIRVRGFAIDNEEVHEGVRCVGAPIFNFAGDVVASIGISGPVARLGHEHIESYGRIVMRAADTLSKAIGGGRPLL